MFVFRSLMFGKQTKKGVKNEFSSFLTPFLYLIS
jgi:hypothetical protein